MKNPRYLFVSLKKIKKMVKNLFFNSCVYYNQIIVTRISYPREV